MKRKKVLGLLLTGVLCASMMTGCGLVSAAAAAAAADFGTSQDGGITRNDGEPQEAPSSEIEEVVSETAETLIETEETASERKAEVESSFDENSIRFTSVDLEGIPVDESIFADADLTVVHIWGTFCGPCIMEMPDYAEFYQNMPEGVNLIGIVCDVTEDDAQGIQDAKEIMDDAGATFLNVCASDTVLPLIEDIQFVPSVFFVDRNGHQVGEMMDGASYEDMIQQLSTMVE